MVGRSGRNSRLFGWRHSKCAVIFSTLTSGQIWGADVLDRQLQESDNHPHDGFVLNASGAKCDYGKSSQRLFRKDGTYHKEPCFPCSRTEIPWQPADAKDNPISCLRLDSRRQVSSSQKHATGTPNTPRQTHLVAPYRAILRYYRCDTPYRAILFKGGWHSPRIPPPYYLVSQRYICAIPHFATYRAIIVPYPIRTSTKEFCDTIATSIARYEKYRCWASTQTHKLSLFSRAEKRPQDGLDVQSVFRLI